MTQHLQRPTAKIYAFPTSPRLTSGRRNGAYQPARHEAQFAAVEFGAGWYHEAALDDVEEDRKVTYRKH